jgi:hypothetical protein
MNKLLSAIGHFFKNAAVFVGAEFEQLFGPDAAHNFAVGAEGILKSELGKIVWTAVNEAGAAVAGIEARSIALSKIALEAKTAGIEAKDSIVNMLLEIAVQKTKNSFGPDSEA